MNTDTLVVIIVIGLFIALDIGLVVITIIEADKLSNCTGKQSLFCPYLTCDGVTDTTGTVNPGANLQYGYNSCSTLMYRLLDSTGSATDKDNVECNLPTGTSDQSVGAPT
jgi:hypothetical protein